VIKLFSVVTDLHGVTGPDIMDHLIAGARNPQVLARLARAAARRKITELGEALEGAEFFPPAHAALLAAMLARIGQVNTEIARLSEVIETLLAPFEEQLQQAGPRPGWGRRAAADAAAGTGTDMTRFRTGAHLASWAGRTPLDHQSGSRTGRAKSTKGNRYLAAITGQTAIAAGKTQTREGARYRRLARRRGKATALAAAGHTQMKVCHALLSEPRHPVGEPRRRLPRPAGQHPPADPSLRQQARRPRPRSHPLPHPRTRARRRRQQPSRLTTPHPQTLTGPNGQGPPPRAQLISIFRVSAGSRSANESGRRWSLADHTTDLVDRHRISTGTRPGPRWHRPQRRGPGRCRGRARRRCRRAPLRRPSCPGRVV
jgi:Transposase IS116/IS110/IS902 family